MKNRRNLFPLIMLSSLIALSVYSIVRPIIGERVTLKVKGKDGEMTKVYLKANGDDAALSEMPDMRGWYDDSLNAIPSVFFFLYKNTIDTLYLVWFDPYPQIPPLETNANIKFIYEPGCNPKLVDRYVSHGFTLFPKGHYQ